MRGRRSKSKLLCGVAAGALASALGTPGMAQAQPYDWTGFYVGAYAGGAWGHSNAVTGATCPALGWTGTFTGGYFCSVSTPPASSANAAAVSAAGTGPASSSAFVGGGQAGYNWQANNIVYGIEADIGSFSLKASRQGGGVYPTNSMFVFLTGKNFTVGSSISTDWLFTARGRLGWTVDNWLLFATGGLAVTNLQSTLNFSDNNAAGFPIVPGASGFGSNAQTKVGLALGAGAQYALNKNWSLKAEYLYVSFNSIDTTALVTHQGFHGYTNMLDTTQDLKAHMARVGVNYRF